MTDPIDPQTGVVPERRPRVKLEELPRGQGWAIWFLCIIIAAMGFAGLVLGGLQATGHAYKPDSQLVWQARQEDAFAQSYDQYVSDLRRTNEETGVLIMGLVSPLAVFFAWLVWYTSVSEVTKCPKGHVVRKSASYCPDCGVQVYSKEELAPEEWGKRYGASGGVH